MHRKDRILQVLFQISLSTLKKNSNEKENYEKLYLMAMVLINTKRFIYDSNQLISICIWYLYNISSVFPHIISI
jgi:hypothetical protein